MQDRKKLKKVKTKMKNGPTYKSILKGGGGGGGGGGGSVLKVYPDGKGLSNVHRVGLLE